MMSIVPFRWITTPSEPVTSLSSVQPQGSWVPLASFMWTCAPAPTYEPDLSSGAPDANLIDPSASTERLPNVPLSEFSVTPPVPTSAAFPDCQVQVAS